MLVFAVGFVINLRFVGVLVVFRWFFLGGPFDLPVAISFLRIGLKKMASLSPAPWFAEVPGILSFLK